MCDLTDKFYINEVVSVRGTAKVCQLDIEIEMVRVCHRAVIDMHKDEEKKDVLDPITKAQVNFGTM